jgi:hypothetical protein
MTTNTQTNPSATESLTEQLQQAKQAAEAKIDAYLKEVGITDPGRLIDEDGWRHFRMGSASGFAYIEVCNDDLYLNAAALVMPLPSDKDLIVPLMREILELNMLIAGTTKLGISEEMVFATAIRRVDDLQEDDIARCIHGVMSLADDLDDRLIEKYGGTSMQRG